MSFNSPHRRPDGRESLVHEYAPPALADARFSSLHIIFWHE
jgi:hypothetical protein